MKPQPSLDDIVGNLLNESATLVEAIEAIDGAAVKIVLVLSGNTLVGSVTDGDIRRALLKGKSQNSAVSEFMHADPVTIQEEEFNARSREELLSMMESMDVKHIPIVDAQKSVLGIITRDALLGQQYTPRNNPVIIMAGGKGTRLLPLTTHIPKPMVAINGRPMLEWIIKRFISQGFKEFYLAINHLGHIIEDHFGNGESLGCNIHYVQEETPLGTAGALGLLPPDAKNQPALIINGDILVRLDFGHILDYHIASGGIATVCAKEHRHEVPFGVIEMKNGYLQSIIEKPSYQHHVSAGIYVMSPEAFSEIKNPEAIDMPNLLRRLMQGGNKIAVFPLREDWVDVGRPDTIQLAESTRIHA